MPESKSKPGMEFNKVQREVLRSGSKPEFRAAVGLSREWDARKAGREVARDTLEKLGTDPDFFLLFSTIHYEKWGGFKEFLAGVWDVLPEGTPLIGGTVAGFIIPQGCFTRGATALAVSYPNMDVAVGIGRNTKRAPHLAAKHCAKMIKRGLKGSRYENKFIYCNISNGVVPQFPIIGRKRVIRQKQLGNLSLKFTKILNNISRYGVGREAEVLECLSENLQDYSILTISSYDDNNSLSNYQFLNKNTWTNSITALGIKTDITFGINTTFGLTPIGIELTIADKELFDCSFGIIDDDPATERIMRELSWPENFFDERMYRRTYYYPLCYKTNDILHPVVMGLVLGKYIVCTYKIVGDRLVVYHASGEGLINSVKENLSSFLDNKDRKLFGLVVSCTARLEALGAHIYDIRNILMDFFDNTPFLVVYGAGEGTYTPQTKSNYFNESFNVGLFYKK